MTRYISIVGNAPGRADHAAAIDAADRVVRFNGAHGFGTTTGRRVDALWMVNAGGAMGEWLAAPDFGAAPALRAAPRVVLPIHPDMATLYPLSDTVSSDGVNHAEPATRALEALGKRVELLPLDAYLAAARAVGIVSFAPGTPVPSTGFLAMHAIAAGEPEAAITLYGFTFAGWDGHAWERERAWAEAHPRIRIVDPVL